jgi:PAS domain S-box-containing protein
MQAGCFLNQAAGIAMSQTVSSTDSSDELERLRAQLVRAEARLAEAQRIAQLGSWEWDIEKDIGWWSPEIHRIFGMAPDEPPLTYATFLGKLSPVDAERVRHAMRATLADAAPFDIEYRIMHADGTPRFIHARGEVLVRSNGVATRMAGTLQDVTTRRRLERELVESEARCQSIFERVPLGITVVGPDGRFSKTNPAWSRMTGYSAEDLAQMNVLDVTHPDDRAESLRVRESSNTGNLDEFALDKRYVRRNDEVFSARTIGAVLRDEHGAVQGRVAIIEDVTEKKEIERRRAGRRQQQRDALVREVHHRIKNHLQGIAGLLERHAAAKPALEPAIEELLGRLNVLATVHGLQSEQPGRELNLCNIARGIVDTLQVVSGVPLEFALPQGFVPVEVNVEEAVPIALILNELVSNAVKHLAPSAKQATVKIEMKRDGVRALVVVRNEPASLPPGFDFADGRSLGTGLRLAKSLLPGEGARLSFSQPVAGVVESLLELWPPVLNHAGNSVSET